MEMEAFLWQHMIISDEKHKDFCIGGEKNVISTSPVSKFRSAADTPKQIIRVSASLWLFSGNYAHILVASGVAVCRGDDDLGWIAAVVQGFLSQIFCQIRLRLVMW